MNVTDNYWIHKFTKNNNNNNKQNKKTQLHLVKSVNQIHLQMAGYLPRCLDKQG